VKILVA